MHNPQNSMMNSNWHAPPVPCFSPSHDSDDVIGQVSQSGQDTIVWGGPGFFRPMMAVKKFCSPDIHLAGERWSLKIEPSVPQKCCLVLRRHGAGLAEPAKAFNCKVVIKMTGVNEQVFLISRRHFGERYVIGQCMSWRILTITLRLTEVEAALQVPPVPCSSHRRAVIGQVSQRAHDTIVWDGPGLFLQIAAREKFCSPDIHLVGKRWSLEVDWYFPENGLLVLRGYDTGPTGPAKKSFYCTLVVKSADGKEEVFSRFLRTTMDGFLQSTHMSLAFGACISSRVLTITLRLEELGDASQGPSCTTFKSCKRKAEVFDIESGQVIEDESDDCRCSEAKGAMLLSKHMNDILEKSDDCDVRFHVQNKVIPAHSFILKARRLVFCTMLTHDTQKKKPDIIRIDDCDADAFRIFLVYLYTGKAEGLMPKKALDLYYIADKYDFSDLKELCVALLKRSLSKTTLCDVVLLSTTHDESELMEVATNFFVQNIKEIIGTAEWQNFMAKHPAEANKLYTKYTNMSVLSGSMVNYSTA